MASSEEEDKKIVAAMKLDPPGTIRTLDQRMAFEREWDRKFLRGQRGLQSK